MLAQTLGKYRIVKWLGGGQFGDVYLAYDTLLKENFALKVSRMRQGDTQILKEEAKLLLNLEHRNIVRFYNIDYIDGKLVLITEYVKGKSLREMMERDELDFSRTINIIEQCLEGLGYAHKKKVVHRDLKPENILVSEEGLVKITDFGLGKFLRKGNLSATIAGTPIYMAPEAWKGEFYLQSDIYSLSAVLYEMVTKRPPFLGESLEEVRNSVFKKEPLRPKLLNPSLPETIDNAIMKGLSKKREARPTSVEEFHQLLFRKTLEIKPITIFKVEPGINLTSQQKEIVQSKEKRLLVTGGPGTGKTTTLIYKIYHSLKEEGAEPENILCLTFTQKAAKDIKERLERLLKREVRSMVIGTFHNICYQILKAEAEVLDFALDFEVVEPFPKSRQFFIPGAGEKKIERIKREIERLKSIPLSPEAAMKEAKGPFEKLVAEAYKKYQDSLREKNILDFDDLLYYTHQLLSNFPEIREKYTNQFPRLFVDELQDLTPTQYQILQLFSPPKNYLFLTGDASQSIYEWRNARPQNISLAKDDFACRVYHLTTNFRLPQRIYQVLSNLLKEEKEKPPIIITKEEGSVELFPAENEEEEALFLVKKIKELVKKEKRSYSEIAVLCRANYQSRIYEEKLGFANIPYNVIGNERFYEREEIKNLTRLLRAIAERDIAETKTIVAWLAQIQKERLQAENETLLAPKSDKKVNHFLSLVNKILSARDEMKVEEVLEILVVNSPLFAAWQKRGGSVEKIKIDNVKELIEQAKGFSWSEGKEFAERVSLLEDLAVVDWGKDFVRLMTVHAAKGLEFPIIFLVGMVEGQFPLLSNLLSQKGLAEERRLCYVALSRAKEKVYISYPKRIKGRPQEVSRFIPELLGL